MLTKRTKELRLKAYNIIDLIDIKKLSEGIDNIELAYILSMVDNIVTIKCNLEMGHCIKKPLHAK